MTSLLDALRSATSAGCLARRLDQLGWRAWVDRGCRRRVLALGFYLLPA